MLLELILENFILVREANLVFSRGFTVFTGETGAGKSVMVQALKLLMGARADSGQVKTGAAKAVVQGVFRPSAHIIRYLEGMGIDVDDELIVRRIISREGRGRIYINGAVTTLQDLRRITPGLLSLSGQHDFQELLRQERHGPWLDAFAGLEKDVRKLAAIYNERLQLERRLKELEQQREKAIEEQERYQAEANAIDEISPRAGEDQELERELSILRSAKDLRMLGQGIYEVLYGRKGSVQEELSACRQDLEKMTRLDQGLEDMAKELEGILLQVQEFAWTLRDYVQGIPTDLSRLEQLEERLYNINRLKRRFGPGIDDVIAYRQGIEEALKGMEETDGIIRHLREELEDVERRLVERAVELSAKRRASAERLSAAVERELSELNLANTRFIVDVKGPENPAPHEIGPRGADQIRFLFSANVGEPPRPLAAIASGGELSRVMLALRAVLSRQSGMFSIVFDEIDAGIGGEVADKVGRKLKALSEHGQVVAITHFPQIAAMGEHHFLVEKRTVEGSTLTEMRILENQDERIEELSRMLGGDRKAARIYAGKLFGSFLRGA